MNRAGLEELVATLKDEEAGKGVSVFIERRKTLANMDLLGEGGGKEGTEILSMRDCVHGRLGFAFGGKIWTTTQLPMRT